MSKSRRIMRRAILSLAAVSALVLALPSLAGASVGSDPGEERPQGMLDAAKRAAASHSGSPAPLVADNFQVLGHANLGGGVPNGDVWFYDHGGAVGKFAYVGTWSAQCTGQGAKVIDVNDPTKPKWVGYVGAQKDSSNEDVDIVRIGGRDVLGIGQQICGRRGRGGLALFYVTDPRHPVALSFFPTVSGGVHELDLVVRADGRALALLAVPFAEFTFDEEGNPTPRGEFVIVDITDPRNPQFAAEWRLYEQGLTIHDASHEITSPFQGNGL